jgi:UDP-N-acetylglucosamine 1-carboxyvinyltransferase
MIDIIEAMGAKVEWKGKRTVSITAKDIDPRKMDFTKVKQMRSSILLLGALSARAEKFKIPHPGGCAIGSRPVGTHFDGLYKMGVDVRQGEECYEVNASKAHGGEVVLQEFSVTATENLLMLAAAMPVKTTIKIAAAEPHVQDLCAFLKKIGASIKGVGTHTLEVTGKKMLGGTKHSIIPDANEAATFLIMGVAAKSPIIVEHAIEDHLTLVLEKLRQFGADFEIEGRNIRVKPTTTLKAIPKLDARIYPGVPTDIQAPMGVLATQAEGTTLIHDTLYEGRFKYMTELEKMGANVTVVDPHRALVTGSTPLYGKEVVSFDLRAGAAMIIAALIAEGTTTIDNIYQVDRGYEHIEERLQKIGANIERVS